MSFVYNVQIIIKKKILLNNNNKFQKILAYLKFLNLFLLSKKLKIYLLMKFGIFLVKKYTMILIFIDIVPFFSNSLIVIAAVNRLIKEDLFVYNVNLDQKKKKLWNFVKIAK